MNVLEIAKKEFFRERFLSLYETEKLRLTNYLSEDLIIRKIEQIIRNEWTKFEETIVFAIQSFYSELENAPLEVRKKIEREIRFLESQLLEMKKQQSLENLNLTLEFKLLDFIGCVEKL